MIWRYIVILLQHYYVFVLFSYFYGLNTSLKYVVVFLEHIFYFIYSENKILFLMAREPKRSQPSHIS